MTNNERLTAALADLTHDEHRAVLSVLVGYLASHVDAPTFDKALTFAVEHAKATR